MTNTTNINTFITMDVLISFGLRSLRQQAVIMSEDEFAGIKNEKETPSYVVVGNKLFYNSYTCCAGFDGTCNCVSHPRKEWEVSPLSAHSFRGFSQLYCPRCNKGTQFFIKSDLPKYDTEQCTLCNWDDFNKKVAAAE